MPVPPGAIDRNSAILPLLAPARPLPAAPEKPQSNRPVVGEADAPQTLALVRNAAETVRGPIGSTATVGGNGAHIGAPGISGIARQNAVIAANDVLQAIGNHVDAKA